MIPTGSRLEELLWHSQGTCLMPKVHKTVPQNTLHWKKSYNSCPIKIFICFWITFCTMVASNLLCICVRTSIICACPCTSCKSLFIPMNLHNDACCSDPVVVAVGVFSPESSLMITWLHYGWLRQSVSSVVWHGTSTEERSGVTAAWDSTWQWVKLTHNFISIRFVSLWTG